MKKSSLQKHSFTLIELSVVIAIILLISGVAVYAVARIPAGVIMGSNVAKIESLMVTAQAQSSLQGVQKTLNYFDEEKKFVIEGVGSKQGGTGDSAGNSFTLDEKMNIEFPDFEGEEVQYNFFPDGSASGPDMMLSIKGHKRLISVSPLTGIVFVKDLSDE